VFLNNYQLPIAKTALRAIVYIGLSVVLAAPAMAEEVIRDFNSLVYVTKDGDLDVEETITMDFGSDHRHGLLRWIPVEYKTKRGKYKTPTRVQTVTVDGAPAQHWDSNSFNNLQIKIGDPDRTITGVHVYKLHYLVSRAINFFDNQPEIYWNATGNESPFRIERARGSFVLPAGVSGGAVRAKAFRGAQGSHELANFTKPIANQIDFQTSNLAPREGLTYVLRLPPGSVTVSSNSEMMWWLMDWWPALFTPWMTLLLVITNWWVNGRDPADA
jgi:hypothetical protein